MGLDGGTYITRSDVLRRSSSLLVQADETRSTRGGAVGTARVFKKRRLEGRDAKEVQWSTCSLSGEPLAQPVVADFLGSLYNKDAVLEFLLARQGAAVDAAASHRYLNQLRAGGGAYDHLTSTRDVFAVRLDPGDLYRCPLTDLPCVRVPFAALSTCGHVFSERAIKEVQQTARALGGQDKPHAQCPVCATGFSAQDVVAIYGGEEDLERLRERERMRGPERRRQEKMRRRGKGMAGSGDGRC